VPASPPTAHSLLTLFPSFALPAYSHVYTCTPPASQVGSGFTLSFTGFSPHHFLWVPLFCYLCYSPALPTLLLGSYHTWEFCTDLGSTWVPHHHSVPPAFSFFHSWVWFPPACHHSHLTLSLGGFAHLPLHTTLPLGSQVLPTYCTAHSLYSPWTPPPHYCTAPVSWVPALSCLSPPAPFWIPAHLHLPCTAFSHLTLLLVSPPACLFVSFSCTTAPVSWMVLLGFCTALHLPAFTLDFYTSLPGFSALPTGDSHCLRCTFSHSLLPASGLPPPRLDHHSLTVPVLPHSGRFCTAVYILFTPHCTPTVPTGLHSWVDWVELIPSVIFIPRSPHHHTAFTSGPHTHFTGCS